MASNNRDNGPMFFFATACKDNILLAHLNLLYAIAYTVCSWGTAELME